MTAPAIDRGPSLDTEAVTRAPLTSTERSLPQDTQEPRGCTLRSIQMLSGDLLEGAVGLAQRATIVTMDGLGRAATVPAIWMMDLLFADRV